MRRDLPQSKLARAESALIDNVLAHTEDIHQELLADGPPQSSQQYSKGNTRRFRRFNR